MAPSAHSAHLLLAITLFLFMAFEKGECVPVANRDPLEQEQFHSSYSHFDDSKKEGTVALWGQNNAGANREDQTEQQIGYFHFNDGRQTETGASLYKYEFGVHRHSSKTPASDGNGETKFLSAGLEGGLGVGLMGRAAVVDATVNAGFGHINMGITADTGIVVDDGIEAKFLGVGGKVGKNGVQICIWFCLGLNW